jgi:hypothetical protein
VEGERQEVWLQVEEVEEPIESNGDNMLLVSFVQSLSLQSHLILYVGLLLRRELIVIVVAVVLFVVGSVTIVIHGSVINP